MSICRSSDFRKSITSSRPNEKKLYADMSFVNQITPLFTSVESCPTDRPQATSIQIPTSGQICDEIQRIEKTEPHEKSFIDNQTDDISENQLNKINPSICRNTTTSKLFNPRDVINAAKLAREQAMSVNQLQKEAKVFLSSERSSVTKNSKQLDGLGNNQPKAESSGLQSPSFVSSPTISSGQFSPIQPSKSNSEHPGIHIAARATSPCAPSDKVQSKVQQLFSAQVKKETEEITAEIKPLPVKPIEKKLPIAVQRMMRKSLVDYEANQHSLVQPKNEVKIPQVEEARALVHERTRADDEETTTNLDNEIESQADLARFLAIMMSIQREPVCRELLRACVGLIKKVQNLDNNDQKIIDMFFFPN